MISNRELALQEREEAFAQMTAQERCDFRMLECEEVLEELFDIFESKTNDDES